MLSARHPGQLTARPAAARAARSRATAPTLRVAPPRRRFLLAFARGVSPRGTFRGFRRLALSLAAAHPASRSQRWLPPSYVETARATETRRRSGGAAGARLLSLRNRKRLRRLSLFGPRSVA